MQATPPLASDALLRAALRGEAPAWPGESVAGFAAQVLDRATFHGVMPLLHESALPWPAMVLEAIRSGAIANAMWELRHQQLLDEVLAALAERGVASVLIKGTALAYGLYPEPALRARSDTDLVIGPDDRPRVEECLVAMGFERQPVAAGEFTAYQASYVREGHTLDVHWKINNSEVLSRLFTHDELRAAAKALPMLSRHAWGTDDVHALVIACMHRATHRHNPYYSQGEAHHEPDRLLWLYDIHLLAGRLTGLQWHQCIRLARAKGLLGACAEGLQQAKVAFGTQWPPDVDAALNSPGSEAASGYLGASALRQQWLDFRALGSWRSMRGWLRERLLPAPDYMRRKYAGARAGWLPWLYLRRAAGGVWRRRTRS